MSAKGPKGVLYAGSKLYCTGQALIMRMFAAYAQLKRARNGGGLEPRLYVRIPCVPRVECDIDSEQASSESCLGFLPLVTLTRRARPRAQTRSRGW